MIQRRKKTCSDCNKEQYIFSHGRCGYCDSIYRARKEMAKQPNRPVPPPQRLLKPLSRKSNGKIPLVGDNRSERLKEYNKIIKKMDQDKEIYCFFCGERMAKGEHHHHLHGRENDLLNDQHYLVHAHATCHTDYHDKGVADLPWFDGYLNRLSDIDVQLAEREAMKRDKLNLKIKR